MSQPITEESIAGPQKQKRGRTATIHDPIKYYSEKVNQDVEVADEQKNDKKKRHQKYANKALLEKGKKIKEANSPKI